MAAIQAATEDADDTSTVCVCVLVALCGLACSMAEAVSARGSAWMSARERVAPREARRCAVARPMPEAAPVMAMTLPWRSAMVGGGGGGFGGLRSAGGEGWEWGRMGGCVKQDSYRDGGGLLERWKGSSGGLGSFNGMREEGKL